MGGWFKFHREWLEHPIINKDADYLRVWIELHNMAAFDNSRRVDWKGKVITLKPGQLTAGRHQLAELTGVNESKVYRILDRLKSEHLIEQQTNFQTSLISICSWVEEQQSEQPNEQRVNSDRTASEQRVNTNKEVKKSRSKDYSYYPENNNKSLQMSDVLRERMEALKRGEL